MTGLADRVVDLEREVAELRRRLDEAVAQQEGAAEILLDHQLITRRPRARIRCNARKSEGLKEMAEIVGVDHVCIGTDQFDSRGCVEDYTRWVHLIAAMLRGGFTAEDAGKIAGGNYLCIFRAAVG